MAYTVLVADDDKDIRSVLCLYLEGAGYSVVEVADGNEALRVLQIGAIDLCLLEPSAVRKASSQNRGGSHHAWFVAISSLTRSHASSPVREIPWSSRPWSFAS